MSGQKVAKGYKQTEVGVIPEDWDVAPLSGNVSIIHGYGFQSQFFASQGDFALMTPGNFYEDGGFRDLEDKQKFYNGFVPDAFLLNPGDLIIAMTEQADGLLGSAAFIPDSTNYLHNQRLGKVKVNSPKINIDFLYWIFNSRTYRKKVNETAAGRVCK